MNWKSIPDKMRDDLLAKKIAGVPVEKLASEINMRPGTLDRRLREWAHNNTVLTPPKIKRKDWTSPPEFSGDAVITGDYHLPFLDYDFAERMLALSRGILSPPRRLIIAGDLFNFDFLSRFPRISGQIVTLRAELNAAEAFLRDALAVFDDIDVLLGNHEKRVIYHMLGQFGHEELEALVGVDNVRFHGYSHCIISTKHGEWRATHQRNYSRSSQSVGVKLAHKYGQHIITHHQHIVSKGFDTSGRHVVIDNGCMASPKLLDYANITDNTFPTMMQSFVIIKDGTGSLLANHGAFSEIITL